MKKDKNNVTIYGPILVRFKYTVRRNYIFKNNKNLAETKQNLVNDNVKTVFINENLTPRNKKKSIMLFVSGIKTPGNLYTPQTEWFFVKNGKL